MGHHSEAFIGIDTSKLKNAVAIAEAGRSGEVRYWGEIDTSESATGKLVAKLEAKYGKLTFCYEPGRKDGLRWGSNKRIDDNSSVQRRGRDQVTGNPREGCVADRDDRCPRANRGSAGDVQTDMRNPRIRTC